MPLASFNDTEITLGSAACVGQGFLVGVGLIATLGIFDAGETHHHVAFTFIAFEPDGTRGAGEKFSAMCFNGAGGAFCVLAISVGIGNVNMGYPVSGDWYSSATIG